MHESTLFTCRNRSPLVPEPQGFRSRTIAFTVHEREGCDILSIFGAFLRFIPFRLFKQPYPYLLHIFFAFFTLQLRLNEIRTEGSWYGEGYYLLHNNIVSKIYSVNLHILHISVILTQPFRSYPPSLFSYIKWLSLQI